VSRTFTFGYRLAWLPRIALAGFRRVGDFPAAPRRHAAAMHRAGSKRILFLGDFSALANRQSPVVSPAFRSLCEAADVILMNLESPVCALAMRRVQTRLGLAHGMSREFLAEALAAAGIRPGNLIVSLANNHAADQARRGLDQTLEALASMGIRVVGLASPMSEWDVIEIAGMRVAALAFTLWIDRDRKLFEQRIRCAEPFTPAPKNVDLACILPHWGPEFRFRPDDETRLLARRLAGLGPDVIAGSHPHVIQPLEMVRSTLVAYSLGDVLGSSFIWTTWRLRLSLALSVDVLPGVPRGARIAGHEAQVFVRIPDKGRERILALAELPSEGSQRAQAFADRVLGASPKEAGSALAAPALSP
jgi:poly-gamma-glutamate synthesis protein (capsule biosynthesis protein)